MAEYTTDSFSICSSFEVEEEEHLRELVREISEISPPTAIPNRVADLGVEDPLDSEVGFATQDQGDPLDSNMDYMIVNWWEGNETGHAHTNFNSGNSDAFLELLSSVARIVNELDVKYVLADITVQKAFEEIDLGVNIELPQGFDGELHQVTGARFDIGDEDSDYLFQKNVDSGTTTLRYSAGNITVDEATTENLIQEVLKEPIDFVEAL